MFWFRKKKKNNDAFVSLGAGFYQLPLIREAKKLGFKVICIDMDSNAAGMRITMKLKIKLMNFFLKEESAVYYREVSEMQ